MSGTPNDQRRPPAPAPATVTGTARFTRADRLRRRADFLRVKARGERLYSRHFGVMLGPETAQSPRLGLVVTRRLGKAVRRNRVKRLLREFFRRHKARLPRRDLVIMAKPGAGALTGQQVDEELGGLLFPDKDADLD